MTRLAVLLGILMVACGENTVSSEKELEAYVLDESNGLIQKSLDGDIRTEVFVRPTDHLIAHELGTTLPDTATINRLRRKYRNNFYLTMSLSKGDGEALHGLDAGYEGYSELLQTMAFRMNEFVRLTTSENDTIPVSDFILNRTYGLTRSTDVLFVFSKEKAAGDEWIQFEVVEFGIGIGPKKFRFSTRDIRRCPSLKL